MPMVTSHDATVTWSQLEQSLRELAQAKLRNRHTRAPGQFAHLHAELETIREVYLRAHVVYFPSCNCGPHCWRQLMDAAEVGTDIESGQAVPR